MGQCDVLCGFTTCFVGHAMANFKKFWFQNLKNVSLSKENLFETETFFTLGYTSIILAGETCNKNNPVSF